MPSANRETLTTRIVEALPVSDRETVTWDRELPGFGVRVHPSGSKVYMVHKRSGGKSRRVTIGRHGVWSLDAARREAGGIIASMKNGETPSRPGAENGSASGPTIAELAEQYMAGHVAVRCKPTTARIVPPHFRRLSPAGNSGGCASARSRPTGSQRCTTGCARSR